MIGEHTITEDPISLLQSLAKEQMAEQDSSTLRASQISHPSSLFHWFMTTPDFRKICDEAVFGRPDVPEEDRKPIGLRDFSGAIYQQIASHAYPIWSTKDKPGKEVVLSTKRTRDFCRSIATRDVRMYTNALEVLDALVNTSLTFDAMRIAVQKDCQIGPIKATCEYTSNDRLDNYIRKLRTHAQNVSKRPDLFKHTVCDLVITDRKKMPFIPNKYGDLRRFANFDPLPFSKIVFDDFVRDICRSYMVNDAGTTIVEANSQIDRELNGRRFFPAAEIPAVSLQR